MKNLRKTFLTIIASTIALVAATEVSTASLYFFYQPKAPKVLEK